MVFSRTRMNKVSSGVYGVFRECHVCSIIGATILPCDLTLNQRSGRLMKIIIPVLNPRHPPLLRVEGFLFCSRSIVNTALTAKCMPDGLLDSREGNMYGCASNLLRVALRASRPWTTALCLSIRSGLTLLDQGKRLYVY